MFHPRRHTARDGELRGPRGPPPEATHEEGAQGRVEEFLDPVQARSAADTIAAPARGTLCVHHQGSGFVSG